MRENTSSAFLNQDISLQPKNKILINSQVRLTNISCIKNGALGRHFYLLLLVSLELNANPNTVDVIFAAAF